MWKICSFYVTGNVISLGFEVVVRQKKQCEDVTLDIFLYFYILMFFPPQPIDQ